MVLDVDSISDTTWCGCGGGDTVVIQQKDQSERNNMYLALGEGPKVARMIRDAVEENQAADKGVTPHM